MTLFMQMFRVCFAKRLSGKQQALDYDWDMLIPSNIRLELQAPRVERCVVCCYISVIAHLVFICFQRFFCEILGKVYICTCEKSRKGV